MSATMLSN